ncbi:MAG: hypothetical protein Q7S22_04610 [Candidatus Micrarchaeota archaeon]|nr:hypothetical protein [Candidatus Micrarchaeota archaeon]
MQKAIPTLIFRKFEEKYFSDPVKLSKLHKFRRLFVESEVKATTNQPRLAYTFAKACIQNKTTLWDKGVLEIDENGKNLERARKRTEFWMNVITQVPRLALEGVCLGLIPSLIGASMDLLNLREILKNFDCSKTSFIDSCQEVVTNLKRGVFVNSLLRGILFESASATLGVIAGISLCFIHYKKELKKIEKSDS